MTTIAWDGKILASDTLSTSGNMTLPGEYVKTKRVGKYRISFSGDNAPAMNFFKTHLYDDMELGSINYDPTIPIREDFTILIIEDGKNTCMVFNSQTGYWDEFNPPISIGSGSKYALGAMYAGCNAIEAVKVSCKLDTHSGEPITFIE